MRASGHRTANPGHAGHRGFTLVEALIALVVISVGLLGLAQLQMRVLAGSGATKATSSALNLSQQKLAELRGSPFDEIKSGEDQPATQIGDPSRFMRRWVVTDDPALALKHISLTTTWEDSDGNPRALTLSTAIALASPGMLNAPDEDGADPDEDETPEDQGPGSCQCRYQNRHQIVLHSGSGTCCSDQACRAAVPADLSNNSLFEMRCPG